MRCVLLGGFLRGAIQARVNIPVPEFPLRRKSPLATGGRDAHLSKTAKGAAASVVVVPA